MLYLLDCKVIDIIWKIDYAIIYLDIIMYM